MLLCNVRDGQYVVINIQLTQLFESQCEALQLHAIYKKAILVLQVMQESVSGTASHVRCI